MTSLIKLAREYLPWEEVQCVIYHAPCCDGFGGAFSAWKRLGGTCQFIPGIHGMSLPLEDVKGKNVLLIDFSFKRDQLLSLKAQAHKVAILDHHVSAQKDLDGIEGCFFDLTRSGAVLAWHYFHSSSGVCEEKDIPLFLKYIQDRDLWKWENKGSKEFTTAFYDLVPYEFQEYDRFMDEKKVAEYVEKGRLLLEYQGRMVEADSQRARVRFLHHEEKKYTVKVLNTPKYISDIGAHLAPSCDVVMLWWYDYERDVYSVSLRSDGRVDTSIIAQHFGGGGHPKASGFTLKHPPHDLFEKSSS